MFPFSCILQNSDEFYLWQTNSEYFLAYANYFFLTHHFHNVNPKFKYIYIFNLDTNVRILKMKIIITNF